MAAEQAPGPIDFNIPAQPLARALVAFGVTAGLDLYYNASFAEGRRSMAVIGTLTPAFALQTLLQGTGLVPRITGPSSVILVPATSEAALPEETSRATPGRFEPYFAGVQARISETLCHHTVTGRNDAKTFLRIWLAASGVIHRVEVLGNGADQASDRMLADIVQGLAVGAPPPGMPQPVTLVVFSQSVTRQACRASDGH